MRRNLLLSVCFLMASVLFAGPVTKQQAQEMAAQFLAGKSITHRASSASQMPVKVVISFRISAYFAASASERTGSLLLSA